AASLLPRLAAAYDEPFADPSAVPTWYLSRLAREQVIVALSGDGGDELFAGYERHLSERLLAQRSPVFALARVMAALPPLPVENLLYADTVVRLPDDMLTKVDRASMQHSLEVRVPFLSHVFVEFAAGVPVDLKLRGATGKYIVRKAVEPWLPQGALERPKQGFAVPLARWVKGDLGRYAE